MGDNKIIDGRETQKEAKNPPAKQQNKTKQKPKKTEKNKVCGSYNERVRAKCFCRAFKLDFLQLIYKAFLIFKSNLELALSIILKERENYMSQSMLLGGV